VRKGRNSSKRLRAVVRRVAGVVIGANIRIALRFVPSERNRADGPSRGELRAGVARATKRKAARKVAVTENEDSRRRLVGWRGVRVGEATHPGPRPKQNAPPLRNRGAASWGTALGPGRAEGGINRLHVHAVADGTNRAQYLPAVREFLWEARQRQWPMGSVAEQDRAMADWLAIMAFEQRRGVNAGEHLISAYVHVFPELGQARVSLPESKRALAAWQRMGLNGEGKPVVVEAVAAISVAFLRDGQEAAGLLVWLIFDCLMRQQDWRGLRAGQPDVTIDRHTSGPPVVSFMFGVRERGERVKTGSDQGVMIARPWLCAWVVDRYDRAGHAPTVHLFASMFEGVDTRFAEMQARLGAERRVPHDLWHGGASQMVLDGYALNLVQRRGRWESDKSLKRYTKTHVVIQLRAALPLDVRKLGKRFLADPTSEWRRASERR